MIVKVHFVPTDSDNSPATQLTLEPLGPLTHQEWHLSFYSVFIATKNTEEGGSTVRKERKRIQSGNHRGKTTLGNKTHSQTETQRKEGIFDWLPTFGRRGWGIKETGTVKPWTCANAQFMVVPPDKTSRNQRKELIHMKEVAEEGINQTP